MKKIWLILLFFFTISNIVAESYSEQENEYINSIDNEFIKAKQLHYSKDTGLFDDIQEVLVSIKVDESFSETEKLRFYFILFQFVKDINTNLYAIKKLEERDYRRAIRLLPSVFEYIHENKLEQFLVDNYLEAILLIPYLSEEADAKSALIRIGLESPQLFYSNIEDLVNFKYFNSVFIHIGVFDPVNWTQQLDKNPFLSDIALQSSNPILKKVLDIKKRLGSKTTLLNYLDEIVKNSFNDTHELDFIANKDHLTKLILASALNKEAYGNVSAMNYLSICGKWVFDDYIDGGTSFLSSFNTNELFALLVMCQSVIEYDDYVSLLKHIKNEDGELVSMSTLSALPKHKLVAFLKKMEKADLITTVSEILDVEAATYVVGYKKYGELDKLPILKIEWFSTEYNYEKDKQEHQAIKNKVIASTFQLNRSQMSLLSWARNLNKVDSNIISIIKSPIGPRFIEYLGRFHPHIIANNRDKLKGLQEFPNIVARLSNNSPLTIKKYLASSENVITKQVVASNDIASQTILKIYQQYKFNTKAYSLLHKIVSKELTIDQANELGNSELGYLRALMNITIQKNPIGIHSVEDEQNQVSLKYIREINDNPSNSHPHLMAIRSFRSQELYSMMVLGKEEIFQFAFDHFYRFFYQSIGDENLMNFLPKVNHYKFREFCVLLANFNKFSDLLYKNSTESERAQFIKSYMHVDFNDIRCIEQAAVICEFINNCNQAEIQTLVQTRIQEEYIEAEARKDQLAMAVYSLLASNIGHRAVINTEWFIAMEKKYNKYTLSYINVEDIKNKQDRIIEVCYFYNDADGLMSFNSYINTFRTMPKWYIQDLGTYYFISSLEGNDYDIFANKPQMEQAGQNAIKEYLIYNRLEPSIIVHRGHSYHSQKTIDQMIGSPKFIFMGSCGGYYKISELLVRSPNAQILSTKQVGTMNINDPMLRNIHELFRTNQNIDWPKFWGQQEARLGTIKDFKMYVPPHKNNGALFVNAFFKIIGL